MEASDGKRPKEQEEENRRLKRMYAEAAMDNPVWLEIFAKKAGLPHLRHKPYHKKAVSGGSG